MKSNKLLKKEAGESISETLSQLNQLNYLNLDFELNPLDNTGVTCIMATVRNLK